LGFKAGIEISATWGGHVRVTWSRDIVLRLPDLSLIGLFATCLPFSPLPGVAAALAYAAAPTEV